MKKIDQKKPTVCSGGLLAFREDHKRSSRTSLNDFDTIHFSRFSPKVKEKQLYFLDIGGFDDEID
ncbi:hypothetical protein [Thiolapillus sp.]|uniref:hypothetical protein n=1 Tax=Thiolapillus sp. TaxID=2017437 RepID=UPI003AF84386